MAWFVVLFRGDDDRLEGRAAVEGIARYRYQGGGQDHTCQIIVDYNSKDERALKKTHFQKS